LTTFASWYFITDSSFEAALLTAISVVIIACPCALALATPIATLVGIGEAMKRGVLFKATQYIETLAKADVLLLDKTGTITKGKPEVIRAHLNEADRQLIHALVANSKHPVAKGVEGYLKKLDETMGEVSLSNIRTVQARGIMADSSEGVLAGGNPAFIREQGIACEIESELTLFVFAVGNEVRGYFELDDPLKEDAKEAIAAIRGMGLEVMMLTGDHELSAARVAAAVGITAYKSQMMPQEKADVVARLHHEGRIVVMVGDGINDSVALSKADIAIAMHSGADVAIDVSDIVILDDRLESVRSAFVLGHRTYGFIKQNMAISFSYNAVTIPLAMMGYIIPLAAAAAMSLSSLMVVGNSMRIKNIKGK
jgi:Cu+-exporting ATPase